jgi:hypothetical protein
LSIEQISPKAFWLLVAGIVSTFIGCRVGLHHLDKTLGEARNVAKKSPDVAQRIGIADDTYLYKWRYGELEREGIHCFADYYFYVTGEKTGHVDVRVSACGARSAPQFQVTIR